MSIETKRCGTCQFYKPDQGELGSGNCHEIARQENVDRMDTYAISVLADECQCDETLWQQGTIDIVKCPVCHEGHIDLSKVIPLTGKQESWENFFDVLFNLKAPIERLDGGSLSNFWAFIQTLQEKFIVIQKK
jgi:hypothetical protein